MSLGRRLLNNTVLLFGGDQLGNLLQFAFFLVLAGIFGEARIGHYAEALALVGLFALFADMGIVEYTIRHVARRDDPTRAEIARALVLRGAGLIGSIGLALLLSSLLFADPASDVLILILLLGAYQLQASLADVLLAELKGLQLMGRVATVGIVARVITVAGGLALLLSGASFSTVFSVFPLAGFCYLALTVFFSVRRLGLPPLHLVRGRDLRPLLRALLPFGTAILFNDAVGRQDVIILSRLAGAIPTGEYWVALKIASVFVGVSGFFQHAIYPMLSELHLTDPEKLATVCRRAMRVLLMGAFPISAGLFAISERLVTLLYRDQFKGSVLCLKIMSWIVVVCLAHATFSALLSAVGRQHQKSVCLGINLALGISLNLVLIPLLAQTGAAVARVAVEVAPLLMYGWLANRVLPGWKPWSYALRPALASAIMILVVWWLAWTPLALTIVAGAVVYVAVLAACGGIGREDRAAIRSLLPSLG